MFRGCCKSPVSQYVHNEPFVWATTEVDYVPTCDECLAYQQLDIDGRLHRLELMVMKLLEEFREHHHYGEE